MALGTRLLGSRGLKVSMLGLGCAPMSGLYGTPGGEDAASEATIARALDLGLNFFDTADAYGLGHNEMLLGRALRGRRGAAVIATKFGLQRGLDGSDYGVSGRPDYVRRACDSSLRRLGVETIDLYYQHRVDPAVPIEDTIGAMAGLVAAGKVRFLGLSEAAPETLRRAHAVHPISALQSEYSLWTRSPERRVLPLCRELGIGFVPFSPLGRGIFTGAVRRSPRAGDGDFRANVPRFEAANLEKNLLLVDRLNALAVRRGLRPGQLALAWLLARGDGIVPIPGTRRQAHLEENAAAAAVVLTPAECAEIEAAVPPADVAGPRYTAAHARLVDE